MPRRLVFLSCGVTTLPLAPLLASRFTFVIPDGDKTERLCRAGLRAVSWDAFADPDTMAAIPARAAALAGRWREVLAGRADELFGFAGRSRGREALALLGETLVGRLEGQLAAAEYGRSLAATGRLAAAVVHEDVTGAVRAFLAALRAAGVPTLHVPHGLYADDRIVGGDVHGRTHTDVVAVGGVVQRDWFLRRGVPAERLIVTGNPAWDELCHLACPTAPPPELAATGPVVTIATSWLGPQVANQRAVLAQHDRCTRAAFGAVARLRATRPALRLVLKLHPSVPVADEARIRTLAAEAGVQPDVVVRDRAPELLATTDVLVTLPSTFAVEALLAGTPVVCPEFCYDGDAVLSPPAEPEALAAAIASVLDGWGRSADFAARRRAFLARHNGPCDGHAGERVVQLLEEMIVRARPAAPDAGRGLDHPAAARLLIAAGYPASALVLLDEESPASAVAETVRGEALLYLRRSEEAEAAFRRALDAGAGGRARAGLGLLLLERGARDEADMHLRAAVDREPELDWGWSGLGVLAALDGRAAEATALLARALALNPANPDARRALDALHGIAPEVRDA